MRRYFYTDFLRSHRNKLVKEFNEIGLKQIEIAVPQDGGRIRRLCYFFDRVGWMVAAELIDVDYILGPMQHVLRNIWRAMEPFIQNERQPPPPEADRWFDPVFQLGFEWLYKRSLKKDQAELVWEKFQNPRILSRAETRLLRAQIEENEERGSGGIDRMSTAT